eukprot:1645459-Pyramimonas_sp.AAC.1
MEHSSRMAMRARSFSSRRLPFVRSLLATRRSTSVSMDTLLMEWCAFTPTRTMLGMYDSPLASISPAVIMRCTISSSAELDGAHTSTCSLWSAAWFSSVGRDASGHTSAACSIRPCAHKAPSCQNKQEVLATLPAGGSAFLARLAWHY